MLPATIILADTDGEYRALIHIASEAIPLIRSTFAGGITELNYIILQLTTPPHRARSMAAHSESPSDRDISYDRMNGILNSLSPQTD